MIFLGVNEMAPREQKERFKVALMNASPHKMAVTVVKVVQQPAKFGHIHSALTQNEKKREIEIHWL